MRQTDRETGRQTKVTAEEEVTAEVEVQTEVEAVHKQRQR